MYFIFYNKMTSIYLPIAYEDALKGAKPITVDQPISMNGIIKHIPIIIPPLNTNIAFTDKNLFKYYKSPKKNIYNNDFNTPRQIKYQNLHRI